MSDWELAEDAIEYDAYPASVDEALDRMLAARADFVYWGNMPLWSLDEGIALLLGKDPERVHWSLIRQYVNAENTTHLCLEYAKLRQLVLRALQAGEINRSNTPIVFLEWARTRDLKVPPELAKIVQNRKPWSADQERWDMIQVKDHEIAALRAQIKQLENSLAALKALQWDGFDETQDTYSKELAIAVKAHTAVSQHWRKSGVSVKKQIYHWLEAHYPKLFNEEKERIAKICNWQKAGGAPITPSS